MFARRRINKILGNSDSESTASSHSDVINLAPRGKEDGATVSSTSTSGTPERKKKNAVRSTNAKPKTINLKRSETEPLPNTAASPTTFDTAVATTNMVRTTSDPSPQNKGRYQHQQQEGRENNPMKQKKETIENLAPFDACVEACDALAANGGSTTGGGGGGGSHERQGSAISSTSSSDEKEMNEKDKDFKLQDCSVMVSPEGTLLFLPKHNESNSTSDEKGKKEAESAAATLFYPNEDIQSAIITGSDLHPGSDKETNGFTTKGWSYKAASTSIRQSEYSLKSTAAFVEDLILSQKEGAARTMNACDKLRGMMMSMDAGLSGGGGAFLGERNRANSADGIPRRASSGAGGGKKGLKNRLFSGKKKRSTLDSVGSLDALDLDTTGGSTNSAEMMTTMIPPGRVGPLFYPNSTLHGALMAFEQYHAVMAEDDADRWRRASSIMQNANTSGPPAPANSAGTTTATPGGILPDIRTAANKTTQRADRRERALNDIQKQVDEAEITLSKCRKQASSRWDELHKAEDEVQRIVEILHWERSQERERRRIAQENEKRALDAVGQLDTGTTQQEIWELVADVAEDMEGGSFAPTGLPMVKESGPRDQALDEKLSKADDDIPEELRKEAASRQEKQKQAADSPPRHQSESPPLPVVDRTEIEIECCIPQLRAAALAADDAVEDAAGTLLNRLSILDMTQRSARIAAEGCLLSACHAQASCLKSLVALERASIEERLQYIKGLERAVDAIDVRADINNYIEADIQNTRDGGTRLGDDDDGGIASGLAVLNSHSEMGGGGSGARFGVMGGASVLGWGDDDDDGSGDDSSGSISRDDVEEAIEALLTPNPVLSDIAEEDEKKEDKDGEDKETDEDNKSKREQAMQDIDKKVALLTEAVGERSAESRAHRASTCYALNSQRSIRTEVPSSVQFDGLCRVFRAFLNGCDRGEQSDVANAKMCMMLAQTFYVNGKGDDEEEEVGEDMTDKKEEEKQSGSEYSDEKEKEGEEIKSPAEKKEELTRTQMDRTKRIYVKSRLCRHPLFSDEDFWDQALFQCVSESLTKSGVMMNFEKPDNRNDSNNGRNVTKRKIRWYDLGTDERLVAASQVHAVVFSQLGALAHSMVEFGCGIERACAFVRRLSIRHQLPLSQRAMLLQHLLRGKNEVLSEDESSNEGDKCEKETVEKEKELLPEEGGDEIGMEDS